jgi:hypothetical protein
LEVSGTDSLSVRVPCNKCKASAKFLSTYVYKRNDSYHYKFLFFRILFQNSKGSIARGPLSGFKNSTFKRGRYHEIDLTILSYVVSDMKPPIYLIIDHRYLKKSRLLKFCYVPAASAAFSKAILATATNSTNQKNKAGDMCHQSVYLFRWL